MKTYPIYFFNAATAKKIAPLINRLKLSQSFEQRKDALVFKCAVDRDRAFRMIFDRDPAPNQWFIA